MKANKKLIFPITTIAIGVACIVFAIIAFSQSVYVSTSLEYVIDETYGGDAYTGIQNAAAATARNISDLTYMIRHLAYDYEFMFDCFGFIILIAGCLIALSGVRNLVEFIESKKEAINTVAQEPIKEESFQGINI